LAPEVVINFAGNAHKIKALTAFPVADQIELAQGRLIEVVSESSTGTYRIEKKMVADMSADEMGRAMVRGVIRTPDAQKSVLQASKSKPLQRTWVISAQVTTAQRRAIKYHAGAQGMSMAQLVLDALDRSGYLVELPDRE
jgi:hypothetical protein